MTFRKHLGWPVPRDPWQTHIDAVHDKFGTTDLYAGVEAERIALLWIEIEETDPDAPNLPTGNPLHTQKKKNSETPLSEQETKYVQVRFHSNVADQLRGYAKDYDANNGVFLGYILREYYETDGWGYSIEAVESRPTARPETELTTRAEKLAYICEQIDTSGDGDLLASDVRETIATVAGPTVVDGANGYLSDVLDRLGYVYHPDADHLYISEHNLRERHGLTLDDPAVARKPFSVLSKGERIEGIKHHLKTIGRGLPISAIHSEVFDGNGSRTYIRNLADNVAGSDGFAWRTTPSGKKVLRYVGSRRSPSTEPKPDSTGESESEDDHKRREDVEADAVKQMDALMSGYDTNPETDSEGAATDGRREQEQ